MMRLRIRHVTTYDYASPVAATTQLVRMTPRVDPGQRVLEWNVRLEVLPSPSRSLHQPPVSDEIWPSSAMSDPPTIPRNHRGMDEAHLGYASAPDLTANDDGYGNRTHLVAIVGPHVGTRLVATGVVETSALHHVFRDRPPSLPTSFWLRPTPHTRAGPEVAQFAREGVFGSWSMAGPESHEKRLVELMHRVRERVDFRVGATDVLTTADESLRKGAGVCQDHAHVMIAVARSLGIPARYVSGYLWPGHQGLTQASHAWVDAYVPGLGWLSFDPANACRPTSSYVRVAVGLDYFDAPPVRGVRRGGPRKEELGVSVVISPEPRAWGAAAVEGGVVAGPVPH